MCSPDIGLVNKLTSRRPRLFEMGLRFGKKKLECLLSKDFDDWADCQRTLQCSDAQVRQLKDLVMRYQLGLNAG